MPANFIQNLIFIASQNALAVYLIIYLSMLVAGDAASLIGVWLAANGALRWWFLLPLFVAANLTGDFLYYSLGYFLRDTSMGQWLKKHLPHHREIEHGLTYHQIRLISVSKFLPFSGLPIFFSIGWIKTEFWEIVKYDLLSIALWQPILFGFGYFLASTFNFLEAQAILRRAEFAIALLIILVFAIEYIFSKVAESIIEHPEDKK